jgi:hypothetical protein
MADPVLRNWRILGADTDSLGIFVGEVSGHPLLGTGWITTSEIVELGEDRSWAVTMSRRYELVDELPLDQPLSRGAANAVLNRLISTGPAVMTIKELEDTTRLAARLSEAPIKRVH